MDDTSLDELLQQRRQSAGSPLPSNFQLNVRREIRVRSPEHATPAMSPVWQWLLRPRFVTILLVFAMFVGVGIGSRRDRPNSVHAQQALNLDVFGAAAPRLPSTLLSSNL